MAGSVGTLLVVHWRSSYPTRNRALSDFLLNYDVCFFNIRINKLFLVFMVREKIVFILCFGIFLRIVHFSVLFNPVIVSLVILSGFSVHFFA